jgi:hypothetical protein
MSIAKIKELKANETRMEEIKRYTLEANNDDDQQYAINLIFSSQLCYIVRN